MKIETEARDDHQIKMIVEVEPERLEWKMKKAARIISEKNRLPGFRPGKAPYDVVIRYAGEERVQQDAIELLVEEIYPELLKEQNLEPGAMGTLEDVISTNPPKFSFIIPLKPVVDLGDYKNVRVNYEYAGVTDAEVDEAIERFRNSYSTYEPVERAAKEDDILSLTYSAIDLTETPDSVLFEKRPMQIRILKTDEEREAEHPFNGFSRKFLKVKAGEEKELEYTYPEDFSRQDLKGKKVRYHVLVDAVKEIVLPEVNASFIQNFGDFATVEDFKAEVRKQLEANKLAEYDFEYYKKVVDGIKNGATIKYPPQMVDEEKENVLKNIEHDLSHQRMDLDAYLKIRQQTIDEFMDKEVTPAATERLERSLIMNEVSKAENLELSNEDIQASYMDTLNEMAGSPEFKKLQGKKPDQNLVNAIAMEAASRAMNRKVYATLKRIANNETVEVVATAPDASEAETAVETEKPKAKRTRKAASDKEG